MKIVLSELHCVKCGHTWIPRSGQMPQLCPKCKSRKWNGEKK